VSAEWRSRLGAWCLPLAILAPLCLMLGFFFAVACAISMRSTALPSRAASRVYVFESVGTFVGGILFTYVLIQSFDAFHIAVGVAVANCAAAFVVWWHSDRRGRPWGWLLLPATALFVACLVSPAGTVLDFASQALRFPGQALRVSLDTRYGRINVAEAGDQTCFYQSGALVGATDMDRAAEERAYLALLAHPNPKRALLIGGSLTGVLRKALECSGLTVDCVEMDPAIVDAGHRYAHSLDRAALSSPRARIFTNMDGRMFVKRARTRYDVMISALPNPSTGLINRFYTADFFTEARAALSDAGVLLVTVSGAHAYMRPAHRALASSIYDTLCAVFEEVAVLPADNAIYYLATPRRNPGFPHAEMWPERLTRMGIEPAWLTPGTLAEIGATRRMEALRSAIANAGRPSVNTDLHPLAYYHALLLWSEALQPRARKVLHVALGLDFQSVLLMMAILTGVLCMATTFARRPLLIGVPVTCAYAGASGLLLQMVLLFAFQGLYGYAYGQLGIIFAAFMVGTTLGAAVAGRLEVAPSALKVLMLLQTAMAVLAVAIVPILSLLGAAGPRMGELGAMVVIPLVNMCVGTLVGAQFPVGVAACASSVPQTREAALAARLYALDLAGACAGALIGTAVIIPVLGLHRTCWAVSVLSLASLPLLLLSERRRP